MLTLSGAPGDCIDWLNDVPFIACVINLPCIFTHYLELLGF